LFLFAFKGFLGLHGQSLGKVIEGYSPLAKVMFLSFHDKYDSLGFLGIGIATR